MNLLDRLNYRFAKTTNTSSSSNKPSPLCLEPLSTECAEDAPRLTSTLQSNQPRVTAYNYTSPEGWPNPVTQPTRLAANNTLSTTEGSPGLQLAAHILTRGKVTSISTGDLRKKSVNQGSSFYNVSSDEEQSDEDAYKATADDAEPLVAESVAAFERRSLRIRRSLDKAKAALPADFVDRIGVSPVMMGSTYRDPSGSTTMKLSLSAVDEKAVGDQGTLRTSMSDEDESTSTQHGDETSDDEHKQAMHNVRSEQPSRITSLREQGWVSSESENGSSSELSTPTIQIGIQWNTEALLPMEELMPEFRKMPIGSTYLLKAVSQRSGCKCALCGHDSLLLFPVLDVSLASAFWGLWSQAPKNHTRISHHYERSPQYAGTTTEVQCKLFVFRQCRGWYEILNENQQPIPHLTTVEQVRRTKPAALLIRQDLKCLAAPSSLVIPQTKDQRAPSDASSGLPLPPNLLAQASSLETLQASSPEVLPAGTLMNYIAYLPRCQVKRGRKIKELGLLLLTRRSSDTQKRHLSETQSSQTAPCTRAYYIGLEETTPAILPARFALSPVAGPENISGVHSLASILRKFRLPLSIRPVCVHETTNNYSKPNGSRLLSSNPPAAPPSLSCGLSGLPGITFSEQGYLRLESIFRGDLLIISPVSCPERLFLITPSMLPDHCFRLGTSNDPAYLKLLANHRIQATNFLAVGHPKDSLNYLLRHMQDVTREPRDSYTSRQTNRAKPNSGESQMTQEEIYRAYEELDDIYFYIRHGYYPSKSRPPDTPLKADTSNKSLGDSQGDVLLQPERDEPGKKALPDHSRATVPTAEELLAASLNIPARNTAFRSKWLNGSANPNASAPRQQPKEYGL
ncbi:unnamed protein product [Dicrocoelium dendriticum]|nr:unnamed protein product [Dicrocoelium dendriticum]